jgi:hypothetical protein
MNPIISRLALVSALTAMLGTATLLPAAETNNAAKPRPAKESKATTETRGTTYRGTVSAIDTTAMTLTVTNKSSSRVFHVTSETRFTKQDKPAIFSAVAVGDVVGGSYHTKGEVMNLATVRLANPVAPTPKKDEKKTPKKEQTTEAPK